MPTRVKYTNTGEIYEFADDFSEKDIENYFANLPGQPNEPSTVGEEAKESLQRAGLSLGASFGTALRFLGAEEKGREIEEHYITRMGEVMPDSDLQKKIWDVAKESYEQNGSMARAVLDAAAYGFQPRKLAATVPEALVTNLAPIIGAGIGAAVAGPAGALAGASIGAVPTASVEALDVYRQVKDEGGTDTQARMASVGAGAAIWALNRVGAGKAITALSTKGLLGKLGGLALSALTEGTTEVLEEPASAIVKNAVGMDDSVWQAFKDGLDVLIPSALTGGVLGTFAGKIGVESGQKISDQTQEGQTNQVGQDAQPPALQPRKILSESEIGLLRSSGVSLEKFDKEAFLKAAETGDEAFASQLDAFSKLMQTRGVEASPDAFGALVEETAATPSNRVERARARYGLAEGESFMPPAVRDMIIKDMRGKDPESIDVALALTDTQAIIAAETSGISREEVWKRLQGLEVGVKGETKVPQSLRGSLIPDSERAKWLIRMYKGSNLSTHVEEFTHYFTVTAQGKFTELLDQMAFRPWAKATGSKLTSMKELTELSPEWVGFHESFAKSMLSWLMTNEAATQDEASIFSHLKERMQRIYGTVDKIMGGYTDISTEAAGTFRFLLTGHNVGETVHALGQAVENASAVLEGREPGLFQMDTDPDELFAELRERLGRTGKWYETLKKGWEGDAGLTDTIEQAKKMLQHGLSPEQIVLMHNSLTDLNGVLTRMLQGEITQAKIDAHNKLRAELASMLSSTASFYGLGLNTFALIEMQNRLMAEVAARRGKLSDTQLEALKQVDWNNLESIKRAEEMLKKSAISRFFKGLWINSVLSGLTIPGNAISNMAFQAYAVADRGAQGFFDGLAGIKPGSSRRVLMREAPIMAIQTLRGMFNKSVWKETWNVLKRNKVSEAFATKWDDMTANSLESLEVSAAQIGFDVGGKAGEKIGKGIGVALNLPSRVLRATDVWFKAIAEMSSREADLARLNKYGVEAAIVQIYNEEVRDSKGAAKVIRILNEDYGIRDIHSLDKRKLFDALSDFRARRFAEYVTFQSDPDKITQMIASARNQIPFGWMFVPFVQVVANIAKRGAEFVPGVALGMSGYKSLVYRSRMKRWSEIAAYYRSKGEKPPERPVYTGMALHEALAKTLEGSLIFAGVTAAFAAGNLTGPPPEDPKRKAAFLATKQPYSLRVGENWVSYRRMDPFSLPIGFMAAMLQRMEDIQLSNLNPAAKKLGMFEAFSKAVFAAKDFIVDNTFLNGIANVFASDTELNTTLARTASGFMPYSSLIRTLRKSFEANEFGATAIPDSEHFGKMFGYELPAGITQAAVNAGLISPRSVAKIDAFGEVRENKSSLLREWLPIKWQPQGNDFVENELAAIGAYPAPPLQAVVVPRYGLYRLDDDLYTQYVLKSGQRMKASLEKLFQRPGYNRLQDPLRKQRLAQGMIERARAIELAAIKRAQLGRLKSQGVTPAQTRALRVAGYGIGAEDDQARL